MPFHLGAKIQAIGYHVVSHGTVSASLVHPREVFKAALLANSLALLVTQNHPAGSLTPNDEDIDVTRTLVKAGQLMGIKVIDHVIVSSNGLCSLRETRGYLWT